MFAEKVGVAKREQLIDLQLMEWCVRQDLNERSNRYMAVQNPLKVTITNWPEDKFEEITLENLPGTDEGTRTMRFGRELYIEQEDFMEEPPKKFFRLRPDGEVRLKNAYIIKCESVVKDADGNVIEVLCTYDPDSHSGAEQRKVKGTLHWVCAADAVPATMRLYDYLLLPDDDPETGGKDFDERLNPNSLEEVQGFVEPALAAAADGDKFQFMRIGYFCKDRDSTPDHPVFNRVVGLKDSYKP